MKKKKTGKLTGEFWERDAEMKRMLQARIDNHQRKLRESRAKPEKG